MTSSIRRRRRRQKKKRKRKKRNVRMRTHFCTLAAARPLSGTAPLAPRIKVMSANFCCSVHWQKDRALEALCTQYLPFPSPGSTLRVKEPQCHL